MFSSARSSRVDLIINKLAFGICDQPQRQALHGDDYN